MPLNAALTGKGTLSNESESPALCPTLRLGVKKRRETLRGLRLLRLIASQERWLRTVTGAATKGRGRVSYSGPPAPAASHRR